MKNLQLKIVFLFATLVFCGCSKRMNKTDTNESLFKGFANPPAEARPFVRWWWNGNHLQKKEITRQLDVLKKAGIGGVEINPIAMPEQAADIGTQPLTWLSREWNEMLKFTALEARQRGMVTDLIVGSGWPFGGEFLEEDEMIQRIIVNRIPCSGGHSFNEGLNELYKKAVAALTHSYEAAKSHDMVFIRLVPVGIKRTVEIIDLTDEFKKSNRLV